MSHHQGLTIGRRPPVLFVFLLFFLGASLLLSSCIHVDENTPGPHKLTADLPVRSDMARLSFFLNLKESSVPALSMQIAAVEVLIGDLWFPVLAGPFTVETEQVGEGQIFLTRLGVPTGKCRGVRLKVVSATFRRGERTDALEIMNPELEIDFDVDLSLEEGDSKSIFMTWDVEASLGGGGKQLTPAVQVAPQSIPLLTDLAYVACPEIDTVYIIRMDRNWVYGSLGVRGRPTCLEVDTAQNRLYVLAADEAAVMVVSLDQHRVINSFRIPMVRKPNFMTMSSDGDWAYIADGASNNLVRMDLNTGGIENHVRLSYKPRFLLYMADQDLLALSAAFSRSVSLLNPLSLSTVEEFSAGSMAQGMAVSNNRLYVAERASDMVAVYDLQERRVAALVNVGQYPRRLHLSNDRIYVANYVGRSLSVLLTSQNGVSQEIPLAGRPLEMAHSERRNWLYVGDENRGGLTVIDTRIDRPAAYIDLGAVPGGLVVIDQE